MYDSGAHTLNAMMWLMNDPVVEVACFYDKCGSPVDINGVAIVKFQNGAMGSITIGGNCPPFKREIAIQTDKMLITTDQYGGKLEIRREGKRDLPARRTAAGQARRGNAAPELRQRDQGHGTAASAGAIRRAAQRADGCAVRIGRRGKIVKVKPVPQEI